MSVFLPPPSHVEHGAQAIVAGEETDAFPQAVALAFDSNFSRSSVYCSGTLIGDGVVITAAHCLHEKPGFVYFGSDPLDGGDWLPVYLALPHPGWTENGFPDLALIFLYRDGPVPPLVLSRAVPAPGEEKEIVGFGLTGTEGSFDIGIKRHVGAHVVSVDDYVTYTASGCTGDSGGGDLALTADGWQLVSVNSFVTGLPCDEGFMGSTPVAPYIDWIQEEARRRGRSVNAGPDPAVEEPAADEPAAGCQLGRQGHVGAAGMVLLLLLALRIPARRPD